MIDKAHCQINPDDEEEFEEFYDFSKTYENHPSAKKITDQSQKVKEDEEWEDVDEEDDDGDDDAEEDDNEQEIPKKQEQAEELKTTTV